MAGQIIEMHDWLATPPGACLLQWERAQMAESLANVFGFHALQLGLPELDALSGNRMPHRWLATQTSVVSADSRLDAPKISFVCDFSALPFPANSLDLVVLPHALELTADPHGALREVERVLVPGGRVAICGFNPLSLWGLRQRRAHLYRRMGWDSLFLPESGEFISYLRLRDWLRLLGLDVEGSHFGCYRPALKSAHWLQQFAWMDKAGARWWSIFGSVYFVLAIKRVHAMTPLNPAWKSARRMAGAPVSVATNARSTSARGQNHS